MTKVVSMVLILSDCRMPVLLIWQLKPSVLRFLCVKAIVNIPLRHWVKSLQTLRQYIARLSFIEVTSQVQLYKILATWLKLAADWLASLSAMTMSSTTVHCDESSPPATTGEETATTKGSEVFITQLE